MSQELHLSNCIQLGMTKHPSRKGMNFRHLLGCHTIVTTCGIKLISHRVNAKMAPTLVN